MTISRRTLLQMAASALALAQLAACGSEEETPNAEETSRTLSRLGRDLFPHDTVADEKYDAIAAGFMEQDGVVAGQIAALLGGPQPFWRMAKQQRLALIRDHMPTPGLQAYRFAVLVGLYNDLSITRTFGYEGPSFEEFGYIDRGFDDLDWLPDPLAQPTSGGGQA